MAEGTPCDNGNALAGDTCQAGACADQMCQGSANGTPCDDRNDCTDVDVCRAGLCGPTTEPACRVALPCPATGPCAIEAQCTGDETQRSCQIQITVTIEARVGSRCTVVLLKGTAANAAAVWTEKGLAQGSGQKRKVLGKAKGKVGPDGLLVLRPKLNKVGRRLLGKAVEGQLLVSAKTTIRKPQRESGRVRLLSRLITLVRGR